MRQWVSMFDSGQTSIFDDEWIERPVTVKTVDNVKRINVLICEDLCTQICDIAARMNISISTTRGTIYRQLLFYKIAAWWVPQELSSVQKITFQYLGSFFSVTVLKNGIFCDDSHW